MDFSVVAKPCNMWTEIRFTRKHTEHIPLMEDRQNQPVKTSKESIILQNTKITKYLSLKKVKNYTRCHCHQLCILSLLILIT